MWDKRRNKKFTKVFMRSTATTNTVDDIHIMCTCISIKVICEKLRKMFAKHKTLTHSKDG